MYSPAHWGPSAFIVPVYVGVVRHARLLHHVTSVISVLPLVGQSVPYVSHM